MKITIHSISNKAFRREQSTDETANSSETQPCLAEGRYLRALANQLIAYNGALASALLPWHTQLIELLADPDLECLSGERRLETLAMALRKHWMNFAHDIADHSLKSPALDSDRSAMPVSKGFNFLYERVIAPVRLESRCNRNYPDVKNWYTQHIVFGSGMGAISSLLTVLPYYFQGENQTTLRLDMYGNYLETIRLFRYLQPKGLTWKRIKNQRELFNRFRQGISDVLFVEPVRYDRQQTLLDPIQLVRAARNRPANRPWILVVDSTLIGSTFSMADLIDAVKFNPPQIALEVRSALKLDQVGLELASAGIIAIHTPHNDSSADTPSAKRFFRRLRGIRKLLGSALSFDEMALLDVPWVFNWDRFDTHTQAVLDNNRRVALALVSDQGKLFHHIAHPALTRKSHFRWAESPFILLHFAAGQDSLDNLAFLQGVLVDQTQQRGLSFQLGTSFGFRHHRAECVIVHNDKRSDGSSPGFLKVAMGARMGPSVMGIIELLRELAGFDDFAGLRNAYPDVLPVEGYL
ncbi:MAG: hypothetical protein HQL54_05665 [Magnetococcales bacterium]|nr:hypothetical protein [Magnetococcales bacterium]